VHVEDRGYVKINHFATFLFYSTRITICLPRVFAHFAVTIFARFLSRICCTTNPNKSKVNSKSVTSCTTSPPTIEGLQQMCNILTREEVIQHDLLATKSTRNRNSGFLWRQSNVFFSRSSFPAWLETAGKNTV